MDLRQIAEFSALVSAHGEHVIEFPVGLTGSAMREYWHNSRKLQQEWLQELKDFSEKTEAGQEREQFATEQIEATLEEIFVFEMFTRVWTAIGVATDRRSQSFQYEPVLRNVFVGHLTVRRHALELMVHTHRLSSSSLARIDRMRRRVERWTDVLLGHLIRHNCVEEFAYDASRAREFGTQEFSEHQGTSKRQSWHFVLAGLRLAFPQSASTESSGKNKFQAIVNSVLDCFPSNAFQQEGPFRSLLSARVCRSSLLPEQRAQAFPPLQNLQAQINKPYPPPHQKTKLSFSKLRRQNHSNRN